MLTENRPAQIKRLARIKGQVEGVERMFKDDRYCPEILQQIRSIRAALTGLEATVLEGHLRGCVKKAFSTKDPIESEKKISELIELIELMKR
jgi:DNA-binding FrmR family transcriptional regulator